MTTLDSQDARQGVHQHSGACGDKDDGRCRDKGIEAQAAYIAEHAEERKKVRDSYDGARARYTTVRSGLEPAVAAIGLTVEDLLERTRCQLDDQDVVRVRRAYRRVVKRLKRCGEGLGCCTDDDDDYDDRVRHCQPDDIPGLIAQLTRRTQEARACFEDLIKEASTGDEDTSPDSAPSPVVTPTPATEAPAWSPAVAGAAPASEVTTATPTPTPAPTTGLAARVAALQAEVDAIKAAVAEGSGDPVALYAQALVARRHHKHVWRGFADVNDYMDCLCDALTRYVHGHAGIVELTGRAAVDQCRRDSWTAACDALKADAATEVVAEYLRVCREESDDGGAPPYDHGHGDPDDDDYGGHGDQGGYGGDQGGGGGQGDGGQGGYGGGGQGGGGQGGYGGDQGSGGQGGYGGQGGGGQGGGGQGGYGGGGQGGGRQSGYGGGGQGGGYGRGGHDKPQRPGRDAKPDDGDVRDIDIDVDVDVEDDDPRDRQRPPRRPYEDAGGDYQAP